MNAVDTKKEIRRIEKMIADLNNQLHITKNQCDHTNNNGTSAVKWGGFGDDAYRPYCQGCEKYDIEIEAEKKIKNATITE